MGTLDEKQAFPSVADLEAELARVNKKRGTKRVFAFLTCVVVIVGLVAALAYTQVVTPLRIHGDSMEPTFQAGDIVVSLDYGEVEKGDVVAFEHDGQILVKRVIATAGDEVDINDIGTLFVNDEVLPEPYVAEKSFGRSNVDFPCVVPESCLFVVGDNRVSSVDSRNTSVGFVSTDQVIGELVFQVYPLDDAALL